MLRRTAGAACASLLLVGASCGPTATPTATLPRGQPPRAEAPRLPPASSNVVFFRVLGPERLLLPLACGEPGQPLTNGWRCIDWLLANPDVELDSGDRVRVTRTAGVVWDQGACGAVAVEVDRPDALSGRRFAVAPALTSARVVATADGRGPSGAPPALSSADAARLEATFRELGLTNGSLQVMQVLDTELDGQAPVERLVVARFDTTHDAARPLDRAEEDDPSLVGADAIFRVDGERFVELNRSDSGTHTRVLATTDLDADGRRELWVESFDLGGNREVLARVAGSDLEEVASWQGCDHFGVPARGRTVSRAAATPVNDTTAVWFQTVGEGRLVPLLCADASHGLTRGMACLEWLLAHPSVELASGARIRVTSRADLAMEGGGASALLVDVPSAVRQNRYAVAPDLASASARAYSETEVAPSLDAVPRRAIAASLRAGRTGEESVLQVIQVIDEDLDGDGRAERLVSARLATRADETGDDASGGLFLVEANRVSPVLGVELYDRTLVCATMDLDRDGRREVWIRTSYYEGHTSLVARLSGAHLEVLDQWSAGL